MFVVVGHEFLNDMPEMLLTENDEVIEALLLDCLREPLRVGVLIWRPNGGSLQFDIV